MGLDIVEFVLEVEAAFEVTIPDEDFQDFATARNLTDYLHARLRRARSPICLSQRAFHRLRRALGRQASIPKHLVRVDTDLSSLLPAIDRRGMWEQVGREMGVVRNWRPLQSTRSWLCRGDGRDFVNVIVNNTVAYHSREIAASFELWTRSQIRSVVLCLMADQFGVTSDSAAIEDARFREDLGIH